MFVTFMREPLLCFAQRNVYELFLMLYKHMIFQTMLVIQIVSTMFDSRGTIRLIDCCDCIQSSQLNQT